MKDTPGRWYERIMGKDLQEHVDSYAEATRAATKAADNLSEAVQRSGQLIRSCRCGRRAVYSKRLGRWIHVAPNAEHPAVVK